MIDIVIYGATGSVGRLAAQRLAEQDELTFGLAGRDKNKLEALAATLGKPCKLFVADSEDRKALEHMVRSAKVIANFAGPFARYAPLLIEVCCAEGRDYCDITGETDFIRTMIDQHEETAKRTGSLLIPLAGFDSVPADLLAQAAEEVAIERGIVWKKLTHFYKMKAGLNGGTLATALNSAASPEASQTLDPNLLIPEEMWPKPPRASIAPRFEKRWGRWSTLFFMQPINTAVVRRSRYLQGRRESAETVYEERLILGKGASGGLKAVGMTAGLGLFSLTARTSVGRQLIQKWGPAPGESPPESMRSKAFYIGVLVAEAEDGTCGEFKMEARLEPSNELTALLAIGVAQVLAGRTRGSDEQRGFSTVANGLSAKLKPFLKGVTFDQKVRTEETRGY